MADQVTAYDVAARAGLSVGTVSRYLTGNGYVGEASRARIARAIGELGYVRSSAAASLRTRKSGMLGFVVSDLRNPFTAELAVAIQERARDAGCVVFLAHTMGEPDRAMEAIDQLQSHGVDGIVITPPASAQLVERLAELRAGGTPVVGIGLRTDPQVIDLATVDTRTGAGELVDHLVGLGHARIGYVGNDRSSGRYRGYKAGLKAAGLELEQDLIRVGPADRSTAWDAAEALLTGRRPPTAIFGFNDATALAVLQRAYQIGIRVPEQLSVVGFDDVDLAAHSVPPLTTMAQPKVELGRRAVDMIIQQLGSGVGEPTTATLTTQLVLRASTAAPHHR
ncbi:LacI family DNA-binding transcriptional regulator [Microlunatus soli]|uniref:Transcriptional regulator, LacI family n=1 Tax=Microlunatus soli TaxID=630515 RepID=A0A1H1RML5_9ACTN|nr:LacI family DNA-binding transcriptional regulator [Microlunatus soli]SDS36873.1 transcriptional regulator, LacI family [Microlunatus soli]